MEQERILIVEDEKIIALDLKRRLEKFGCQVVAMASKEDEAVSIAGSERPDLILMDIRFKPGDGDGISAAMRIRDLYKIPVVFLTAYADEQTLERAKIAEPIGYVLKPFKERELYSTINIGLYKSRVDRELLRQERLFSAILHSVGDGIISTDAEGNIQFMNPIAETLTGCREADVKGKAVGTVFQLVTDLSEESVSLPAPGETGNGGARVFESVYLVNRLGAKIHIEGSVADTVGDRDQIDGQTVAFRDVTDIKRLSETVTYQASHDSLTGLLNREEFAGSIKRLAEEAVESGRLHSLFFIDIDQFKVINDVCGHIAGDELLRQIADAIQEHLDRDHVLSRLGADDFGLIVSDTDISEGTKIAKTLVERLNLKFAWQQSYYNVTVSIGLAPVSAANSEVNDILAAADDACNLAKEHGGNTFRAYEQADHTFLKRRGEMQWIARLTQALDENRFVLYRQVIRSLTGDDPDKSEILLRLRDRDGSLVLPGEFIPAAERYKLMPSIDKWVINAVFRYASECAKLGHELPIICINLSGASIADNTLLDYILQMMQQQKTDASHFCFEVTETSAIENLTRATVFINRLKSVGATFALDDFGNGFTSFAYLKRLPVDYLKIDGSFVKGIDSDPIDRSMVESVNNIGHTMGMKTIAEYVQSNALCRVLTEVGVDYGQGFAIARPEPLPHAEEILGPDEPVE